MNTSLRGILIVLAVCLRAADGYGFDKVGELAVEAKILSSTRSKHEFEKLSEWLQRWKTYRTQCEYEKSTSRLPVGCLKHLQLSVSLGVISKSEARTQETLIDRFCDANIYQIQEAAELQRALSSPGFEKTRCGQRAAAKISLIRYKTEVEDVLD